jgi:hypothetical protein
MLWSAVIICVVCTGYTSNVQHTGVTKISIQFYFCLQFCIAYLYLCYSNDTYPTAYSSALIAILSHCEGIWSFATHQLNKHYVKAEIIAEASHFAKERLGKRLFSRQRMLKKALTWQHDRTEEYSTWWLLSWPRGTYKSQCIRGIESETVKYGRESHGSRSRVWLRWR